MTVAVVGLASLGLVSVACSDPGKGKAPTQLRVDVAGLANGVAADVRVQGADGLSYSLKSSDEREVPAGTYTVEIGAVDVDDATAYAVSDQLQVTVKEGRTTTAAAHYRVVIPDTTTVLDSERPAIEKVSGDQVVFGADAPEADTLKRGQIFITAEGPQTPHLLVRRVQSVSKRGDGTLSVDTEPASLTEALPDGVIVFDDQAEGGNETRTADQIAFRSEPPKEKPLLKFDFGEVQAEKEFVRAGDAYGKCGFAGSGASYEIQTFDINPRGEYAWGDSQTQSKVGLILWWRW